jgi:hypothetical protein
MKQSNQPKFSYIGHLTMAWQQLPRRWWNQHDQLVESEPLVNITQNLATAVEIENDSEAKPEEDKDIEEGELELATNQGRYYKRSNDERYQVNAAKQPLSTLSNNATWAKHWMQYKREAGWVFDDLFVSHEELASALCDFFAQVKPVRGNEFRDSTILNAFNAMNRYFKELRKKARLSDPNINNIIDLHNDPVFEIARDAREARIARLQREGMTGINSADHLTHVEQEKLLQCDYFSIESAEGLVRRIGLVLAISLICRG